MATKTFNTRIANKRDTSANWTSNNPVLLNGEVIIVDTEAGQVRYKVGNGTSTYTQLPFTDESLITNINGKLSLSGGTMTGNIDMGGHKLTGLGAPVNPNDAVRQTDLKVVSDEVDGIISGTTGITLAPATTTKIGGIIVGDGIEVEADGTISTNPVPSGGTTGQVLTKTSTGEEWSDAPSGLPDGGTEGQMLYQGANGAEWGIPPYLGSMPQLDYSQMKSLHDLGITDLNDILEPGTYVGMSNFGGYPEIANVPDFAFVLDAFFLNVYKFVDPTDSTNVVLSQTIYPIVRYDNIDPGTGELGGFYRQALGNTSGDWFPWSKVMEAQHISFTPTSTLTSDNVQDAIEEVDTQLSTKLTTPTGTAGQLLGFTADNKVGAVDAPESGLTQEQADERYLQLSGGTVTGEVDMGQNPIRNVSTIFGGTGFTIRSSGGTAINAYILNISTSDGTNIRGGLTSSNIDATNITVSNVGSGDTAVPNKAYVDALKPTLATVTLTTSGWSSNTQTVTVPGVSASETAQLITPMPKITSQSAYYEAGIMCTGQAENSLTFTCQTVPTSNLIVYVVIQPLS